MLKYLRILLLPLSLIYGLVVYLRNQLYNLGVFRSTKFDLPVIVVGNLVVGGSGKSPATEYLINLFRDRKIAVLSRGYGRKTKGFIRAGAADTALTIGDEPLQFYHKFPQITVAVCEDRVKGIRKLQSDHDLILLDDAFQHRSLKPGFSILLFDFNQLNKTQFLLPAGNLREAFSSYRRADLLMITKVPSETTAAELKRATDKFDAEHAVFCSSIVYQQPVSLYDSEEFPLSALKDKTIFLLTGIANPAPLLTYLKQLGSTIVHHDYSDHYLYKFSDLQRLRDAFHAHSGKEKIILTTEKDAQRLFDVTIKELLLNLPVFYLPIRMEVGQGKQSIFDQKLLTYVSDITRDRHLYQSKN
ncbi:tetraacyldisaccharide 4'-kinase [Pedobacter antarcticus 4BY]|uniref:Tetraacyldisaccharide 4'-kinase n=2 Tax=Pedobacter antarcticus TaxID=34086 RepID=A0A081PGY5_9SPHI|nr:tetraacyldisaccharide 4'-kinase [Pedobacter antarcticus]KEQ29958.1 tetraacyldisaccharide 4'-kinase [Pedobacter antarcticus 4BY]SFF28484.1 lipid-A-disaccharide kinase [Pedobacter antarcticus]